MTATPQNVPRVNYKLKDDGAPEPLSRLALRKLRAFDEDIPKGGHMESDSFKRVVYELLRYCHGEIDGLSVLVAGQRGAGKTTLVKLAIQRVMTECTKGLMPLPLILHGPTIIDPKAVAEKPKESEMAPPPVTVAAADAAVPPIVVVNNPAPPVTPAPAPGGNGSANADGSKVPEEKERALRLIVTALYRGLSLALYDAWLAAAREAPERRRTEHELLALRAHLDLRLERAPDPDVLRKIWERAGFLHSGVAFYLRPATKKDGRTVRDSKPPEIAGIPSDQGIREIVALASCADAYRVIISKPQEILARKQQSEYAQEVKFAMPQGGDKKKDDDTKPKSAAEKVTPPVLGTAAGGLAAVVAQSGEITTLAASVGTGLLVWLGSWVAMTYGTRTARQEMRRELTMDIKWDIDRLERDLPLLLKRVKDAGFAPIIVLDELDKVDNAMQSLNNFLKLTKHIVTDQSAFMFLTNRDYYENLVAKEQLDGGRAL
ncbi:hypothetical protein JQ633_00075 [Bradyrhizobium tropiciagri]|uniref:hypothetical protein n=1 Tax=Bradyrhizobium tropiciagri TaxID=312253 RepID=UPI001BA7458A|nr:hypothetical protein [Bradyrhizobium tropiciagri]MBR0868734.1 hypothetical protein [Bradyrhizobium tropiciagri]